MSLPKVGRHEFHAELQDIEFIAINWIDNSLNRDLRKSFPISYEVDTYRLLGPVFHHLLISMEVTPNGPQTHP